MSGTGKDVWIFLGLAVVLLGPFVLREVSQDLEPYPALLMPKGACLAVNGEPSLRVTAWEAHVVQPDGTSERLAPKRLIGRIPVQYFGPLAVRRFGLEGPRWQRRWEVILGRDRWARWTDEDRERTKDWLRTQVAEAGHQDAVGLRMERTLSLIDKQDGSLRGREVLESYHIEFP